MSLVARHYQYRWRWVSAGIAVAVALLLVLLVAFIPTRHDRFSFLLAEAIPLLIASASLSQFSRLEVTRDEVTVVNAWSKRQVNLNDLHEISYRASGRAASCVLGTTVGHFKLPMTTFDHDDVWKPMILQKADHLGIPVSESARQSLSHSDGTGRGWLA